MSAISCDIEKKLFPMLFQLKMKQKVKSSVKKEIKRNFYSSHTIQICIGMWPIAGVAWGKPVAEIDFIKVKSLNMLLTHTHHLQIFYNVEMLRWDDQVIKN